MCCSLMMAVARGVGWDWNRRKPKTKVRSSCAFTCFVSPKQRFVPHVLSLALSAQTGVRHARIALYNPLTMPPPQSTDPDNHDQISIDSSEPDRLYDSDDAQPDLLVGPDTTGHKIKHDNNPRLLPERTYETLRLERPIPGEKGPTSSELVTTHRFYGSSSPASIDRSMLDRLAPGKWLTVDFVNFYIFEVANSYVEQTPGAGRVVCALPESIWSSSDNSHGQYSPRPRRDKAESVLDFDYVAFPGNCTNSHYYLCIIAYASDILADRNPSGDVRTVGLVLNSFIKIGPTDAPNRFRNVILRLGKQRPIREDGLKKLKVYYPRVSNAIESAWVILWLMLSHRFRSKKTHMTAACIPPTFSRSFYRIPRSI